MKLRDHILQQTDGGLRVFAHYLGDRCNKKLFRNPYRSDSSPSCHIYSRIDKSGVQRYFIKDFGDSDWCGDCFAFVGRIRNLDTRNDFSKILEIIQNEVCQIYNDTPSRSITHSFVDDTTEDTSTYRPMKFVPSFRNFNKYELNYWLSYGISLETLENYNVRSLSSCYFERRDGSGYIIRSSREIPMFGYTLCEGKGIKIYRPGAKTCRFMYAGTLPHPYIYGLDQLKYNNEYIVITGGEKDVMTLSSHGYDAISLNSETAKIESSLLEQLSIGYKAIYFIYDCDTTGRRESVKRVKEVNDLYSVYGITASSISLPLSGDKKEKDVSDFFRLGYSSDELRKIICQN